MSFKKKYLMRDLFIFYFIGVTYVFIEVLFRGYSHWSMFILAGLCSLIIDKLNNIYSFEMDILLQCTISTIVCSILEGIFGLIFNIGLGLNIWNYSNMTTPVFFYDQISLVFSIAWFFLSFICILSCDAINYYIFDLYEQPYYKIFSKEFLRFPKKK